MRSRNLILLVTVVLSFQTVLFAEIVYDNTVGNGYGAMTDEVGDTVTLGGSKRFVTSLSFGLYATANDVGDTDYFQLAFYLPNALGETAGTVIWQSAAISYDITTEGDQLVTIDVPSVRVPDTFIWSVRHSGGSWYAFADTPSVGSTPPFHWNDLVETEYSTSSILARIEASDRIDAKLLATKRIANIGGQSSQDRNNIRFYLFPELMGSFFGASFAGVTEWDVGTFPSQPSSYFPEFVDVLTNGQNDSIGYGVEGIGPSDLEDSFFTKSPGVAVGYPDLYGCAITDIGLKIDTIVFDYSTPDYTYYTYDVTWEIWGVEKTADINKDGGVDVLDFALLAAAWDTQEGDNSWNSMCDIALPSDNAIGVADLVEFCSKWLDGRASYDGFAESFETGDFTALPWQNLGDAAWQIVSDESSDGTYSIKSGDITHSQTSGIEFTADTPEGTISFYRKVACDPGYDFLVFYIDGVEQGNWTATLNWSQVSFPVTSGTHTFTWVYEKDNVISLYDDSAWIDQIVVE